LLLHLTNCSKCGANRPGFRGGDVEIIGLRPRFFAVGAILLLGHEEVIVLGRDFLAGQDSAVQKTELILWQRINKKKSDRQLF